MYKQAIIVRNDLKLPKGKLAVQVAHASLEAVLSNIAKKKKIIDEWRNTGAKKVVLKINNEQELIQLINKAREKGLITSIIRDAGLTVIPPGTLTCGAIGPDKEELIDELTYELKLL